jgi:hypothetical protein
LNKPALGLSALFLACAALSCKEDVPMGLSDDLLPGAPTTIEVRLPWEQFASKLEVFGGFGTPWEKGTGLIAKDYKGLLQAHTLGRWETVSLGVFVRDPLTQQVSETSDVHFSGGQLVVFFDAKASAPGGPVTVSARQLTQPFDPITATWTLAVDSVGLARRPWGEAGGGPARLVGSAVWERTQGDSLKIPIDTTALRAWTDPTNPDRRGFRIDAETADSRVEIATFRLDYNLVPNVGADTTVAASSNPEDLTFISNPVPPAPTSGLRVGGIPAWRSIIHMQVPKVLTGPAELCAALGCPFELTSERINHASLVLVTKPTDPPAFQPADSVRIDVRTVLAPERLPKAPLGSAVSSLLGRLFDPLAFQTPQPVSIPITSFVKSQIEPPADSLFPAPKALALLSYSEPESIAFVGFVGPGQAGAPYLRLILTRSRSVELP